ncbi:MAG: hypothetical protein U9R58_10940, partial [Chloroflexota bacterium]|nr:hypothetical protein [Chloroflexota bacterium]
STMLDHLQRMLSFYGGERGLVLFRKHLNRYLSPYPLTKEQRLQILTVEHPRDFVDLLDTHLA